MNSSNRFSQIVYIYLFLFVIWLSLRLFLFDRFWWLALINTVALYIFAPLLFLLPIALWRRQWKLLAGLSFPLGIFIAFYAVLFFPSTPTVTTSPPLTVLTFNMLWSNTDYDAIERLLDSTSPDLVGLQEVRPEAVPILTQRFSAAYPYRFFHPVDRFHNVGILSRFPIQTPEVLPDPPFQRGLRVIVQPQLVQPQLVQPELAQPELAQPELAQPSPKHQPLQVIVAHLTPNYPMAEVVQLAQSWYDQRAAQVDYLRRAVADRQNPTLVLCDCNFTDTSQAYSSMNSFLSDSFREAGWGFGHTMKSGPLPTSRLDYVWHSPELQATRAEVSLDAGSDHLPLLVQLQWQ